MKYIAKTQIISIIFSIFWMLYLNIIAFFDQPDRAMEHINMYVYGFAALFLIVDVLIITVTIRGDWTLLPLIIIPQLVLYQPILMRVQTSLVHQGYHLVLQFLSASINMVYLIATAIAIILGIMIGRLKK